MCMQRSTGKGRFPSSPKFLKIVRYNFKYKKAWQLEERNLWRGKNCLSELPVQDNF